MEVACAHRPIRRAGRLAIGQPAAGRTRWPGSGSCRQIFARVHDLAGDGARRHRGPAGEEYPRFLVAHMRPGKLRFVWIPAREPVGTSNLIRIQRSASTLGDSWQPLLQNTQSNLVQETGNAFPNYPFFSSRPRNEWAVISALRVVEQFLKSLFQEGRNAVQPACIHQTHIN